MNNKIHEFNPRIYPRLLWITVGCSTSELKDLFGEEDIEDMAENTEAEVLSVRRLKPDVKGGVLVRFKSNKSLAISIISHESVHAALEIFDYVGANVEYENQEPFAYLVGWIADCINQVKTGKFKE